LIKGEQRLATRIAQQHDLLDTELLESFHVGHDVDQQLLMQTIRVVVHAAQIGTETAIGRIEQIGKGVVFGELDTRMGCDDRNARLWHTRRHPPIAMQARAILRIDRDGFPYDAFNGPPKANLGPAPVGFREQP
jgi:hypothetical protein